MGTYRLICKLNEMISSALGNQLSVSESAQRVTHYKYTVVPRTFYRGVYTGELYPFLNASLPKSAAIPAFAFIITATEFGVNWLTNQASKNTLRASARYFVGWSVWMSVNDAAKYILLTQFNSHSYQPFNIAARTGLITATWSVMDHYCMQPVGRSRSAPAFFRSAMPRSLLTLILILNMEMSAFRRALDQHELSMRR